MWRPVCLSGLLLIASVSWAHHSPARFKTDQVVVVQGDVVEVDWRNPHVYFTVRDGGGIDWLVEANSTANLSRVGWSRDSLKTGDAISFRANPNRDAAKTHVSLISITKSDGTDMAGRMGNGSAYAATSNPPATSLNGVWQGNPAQAFGMLFAMIDHPLTEKGAAAKAAYDESIDPITECITWPTPRLSMWSAFYLVEIEVAENAAYLRSEFDNTERVIHLDGRGHPENAEPTSQGHSIGRWEDGALVVDTTLFAANRSPVADGIPSGRQKHVVERFTLNEDGAGLVVDLFVEDPEFLAEPFEGKLDWQYSPHLEMLTFECVPEVSGRFVQ